MPWPSRHRRRRPARAAAVAAARPRAGPPSGPAGARRRYRGWPSAAGEAAESGETPPKGATRDRRGAGIVGISGVTDSARGADTLSDGLRARLERCSTLPTMPAVAVRVLNLCQSEDLDLKQLADSSCLAPALPAMVLRLVISPAFGLRQEGRTVPHALALLGLNAVRTLALSFSLVRDLRKGQQSGLQTYWKRSIIAAVAARELANALRFPAPDEAFLAALLQDIGVLALGRVAGREYEEVAARAGDDHERLAALETEAFGADHAAVGGWMVESWKLPRPLCLAVLSSHRGLPAADKDLPADVRGPAIWWPATAARSSCWCCPRRTPRARRWGPSASARRSKPRARPSKAARRWGSPSRSAAPPRGPPPRAPSCWRRRTGPFPPRSARAGLAWKRRQTAPRRHPRRAPGATPDNGRPPSHFARAHGSTPADRRCRLRASLFTKSRARLGP